MFLFVWLRQRLASRALYYLRAAWALKMKSILAG